ncbi:MAG: transketolase C-terminal domain-containing protein [Planctomycetota bacterium]|nr:transketolase C-terminal domain-containing protein [Planctomycetota bacterium]
MSEAPRIATREAYGLSLAELGKSRGDIVVLDADLSGSTRTKYFAQAFPDRFFNCGVAEANMLGVAAGLATGGKTVFASSFAMFATGKAWEQIRQSVCVPELNVKICATHAGLTVGEDGKSHQMLEDITLMRVLPHMTVLVPADATEAAAAVRAAAEHDGPVYIRLSRASTPVLFPEDHPFAIGKGHLLRDGTDLALIACGVEVVEALAAAELLAQDGFAVRVIDMPSIKPIDEDLICAAAEECGAIMTVEEHQVCGGLGDAVGEVVGARCPVPVHKLGVHDTFGQSGTPTELLAHHGLDAAGIATSARALLTTLAADNKKGRA